MKKNTLMRIASVLLVVVIATTCVISGTFAKYITSADGSDHARVAKWGFESDGTLDLNMFANVYAAEDKDNDVVASDAADVIAPGTTGLATFEFVYDEATGIDGGVAAPEVAYTFKVSVDGSSIASSIENNTNITWKLDNGAFGTWDDLMVAILELSGVTLTDEQKAEVAAGTLVEMTGTYAPGELPADFADEHTITWNWAFETDDDDAQDEEDSTMGNADELAEVEIVIAITATQLDEYTAP